MGEALEKRKAQHKRIKYVAHRIHNRNVPLFIHISVYRGERRAFQTDENKDEAN